jgi:hypothetical protein
MDDGQATVVTRADRMELVVARKRITELGNKLAIH